MTGAITFTTPFLKNSFLSSSINKLTKFTLINPSNEERLVDVMHATPEMVDEAVEDAQKALRGPWKKTSATQRGKLLHDIAQAIEKHKEELAYLDTVCMGKPLKEAREDVKDCVDIFRYYAGFADKIYGKSYPFDTKFRTYTLIEPVGVCGMITSFNYPLVLTSWKLAPALAFGNCVILKPALQTPLSSLYLAHIIKENTQLPSGVFSVLPGDYDVGARISSHPHIDHCSFTGSVPTGKAVMKGCSENVKRVTLELGGKSPVAVFPSAKEHLDEVIQIVFGAAFANSGQNCCAGSRLYLHHSIKDLFLQKLAEKLSTMNVGNPNDDSTVLGPIADKKSFDRIQSIINDASIKYNTLHYERKYNIPTQGYFIPPTVFYDVDEDAGIAKDEIFGPVLTILKPFDNIQEVISRMNNSRYGLAAGVFSQDINEIEMVTREVKAGTVWVNSYNSMPPYQPFGGMKMSGFGKELGQEAAQEFTVSKSVMLATF